MEVKLTTKDRKAEPNSECNYSASIEESGASFLLTAGRFLHHSLKVAGGPAYPHPQMV